MAIHAVRVSKTSCKPWELYGPVESALLTSCQAEEVKAIPLHLDDVHGEAVDVELWVNTTERSDPDEEPNPLAQALLCHNELRVKGLTAMEAEAFGTEGLFDELPHVLGVAVLTGAGCSDFPQECPGCVLSSLLDTHGTDSDDFDISPN